MGTRQFPEQKTTLLKENEEITRKEGQKAQAGVGEGSAGTAVYTAVHSTAVCSGERRRTMKARDQRPGHLYRRNFEKRYAMGGWRVPRS